MSGEIDQVGYQVTERVQRKTATGLKFHWDFQVITCKHVSVMVGIGKLHTFRVDESLNECMNE